MAFSDFLILAAPESVAALLAFLIIFGGFALYAFISSENRRTTETVSRLKPGEELPKCKHCGKPSTRIGFYEYGRGSGVFLMHCPTCAAAYDAQFPGKYWLTARTRYIVDTDDEQSSR